jgi:hypothetical protein
MSDHIFTSPSYRPTVAVAVTTVLADAVAAFVAVTVTGPTHAVAVTVNHPVSLIIAVAVPTADCVLVAEYSVDEIDV